MASSTLTVPFIYKRRYAGHTPGDIASRDRVLLSKINKTGGWTGLTVHYTMRYANPQGISLGTLADAQTAVSSSAGEQFAASRQVMYGDIEIDNISAMAAKERGDGAFYDLVTMETDGILDEMGDRAAFQLYRGGAALGRRASISGNVVTLAVADDARNFKKGMTVIADDTVTGASPRVGSTTVAGVNEDAGTVTLTNAAAITSFSDLDYLFAYGSVDAGIMDGLALHIPLSSPVLGSDSFRGVDRGADTARLAGRRHDDTSMFPEDAARLVAVKIKQLGKRANALFLNPMRFYEVSRRLDAKVMYEGGGESADVGFETFKLHTAAGALSCFSDENCPVDRGYVLNLSTWYLHYLGPSWIHIAQDDSLKSLRKTTTDVTETRARLVGNTICTLAGPNGVFSCAT